MAVSSNPRASPSRLSAKLFLSRARTHGQKKKRWPVHTRAPRYRGTHAPRNVLCKTQILGFGQGINKAFHAATGRGMTLTLGNAAREIQGQKVRSRPQHVMWPKLGVETEIAERGGGGEINSRTAAQPLLVSVEQSTLGCTRLCLACTRGCKCILTHTLGLT